MIPHFSDHAANERTFLAWLRTVISVVGFGIGAGRLGDVTGAPRWTEAGVLATGALVVALAWVRMQMVRRRIDSDERENDEATTADSLLLFILLALFLLLGAFAVNLFT